MRRMFSCLLFCSCISSCAATTRRISGGHFNLGCNDPTLCEENEARLTTVKAFAIDILEATAEDIKHCAQAGACTNTRPEAPANVVAAVSVKTALQYCAWKKGRLPTRDEWEVTAGGRAHRRFSWGNTFDESLVMQQMNTTHIATSYFQRLSGRTPKSASEDGIQDLSGTGPELVVAPSGYAVRGAPYPLIPFVSSREDWFDMFSVVYSKKIDAIGDLVAVRCAYDL